MNLKLPIQYNLLSTILSIVVAALGFIVMVGWLFHVPILVQVKPGLVALVFNTGLCFFLTGVSLALPGLIGKPIPRLQILTGAFILSLCFLILIEYIFDRNLFIDWAFLHRWIDDGNSRPGRLAPNTAIGFMFIGAVLVLKQQVETKRRALFVQLLTASILVIGLTGLVGYTMGQDLLFGWTVSARMAIPTAAAMIVVSIVLWIDNNHAHWYQSSNYFQEDEKITFMAAVVLVVVTVTAGIIGFVYQQEILENSLKNNLQTILQNRVILIKSFIDQGETNAINANNDFLIQYTQLKTSIPIANEDYGGVLNNLLGNGFNAVALYSQDGRQLAIAGNMAQSEIIGNLHAGLPPLS